MADKTTTVAAPPASLHLSPFEVRLLAGSLLFGIVPRQQSGSTVKPSRMVLLFAPRDTVDGLS